MLTQNRIALVDDEDYDRIAELKWHAHNMHNSGIFYAGHFFKINGKYKYAHMHTFILNRIGIKTIIYHKDGNGLNNQKENLRICSSSDNSKNKRQSITSKSKYKGVYLIRKSGMYRARIQVDGKRLHLGCFVNQIDACIAYNNAALKYFGEFALINEII